MLAFNYKRSQTDGKFLQSFLLVSWSITMKIPEIVNNFSLYQNYPNPFNPVTSIEFEIKTAGDVQLIVYNISGEKIKTLVDRFVPRHRVEFDGSHLSSGNYFYTLQTKDFRETRMMSLTK